MAAIDISDNETPDDAAGKRKPSGFRKPVLILAVLIVLGGAAAAAVFLYPGLLDMLTGAHAAAATDTASTKVKAPPIYVELGDPFVVNFSEGTRVRYLQVKIEAMTRDPVVAPAIHTHLPRIRNDLVFLLSAVDYPSISTVEGKEKIRDAALKEVRDILKDEIGTPGVEALYFTSFVIQ